MNEFQTLLKFQVLDIISARPELVEILPKCSGQFFELHENHQMANSIYEGILKSKNNDVEQEICAKVMCSTIFFD
jgi:hypothetical protein